MAQVEEEGKVNIDTKTEKGDEEEEEEQGIAEQADKDKETNVTPASDPNPPTESAPLDVSSLPEGYSVLVGEDGQQYVTVEQDGQTYAIPADEYQAVQREGGGAIAIQHQEGGDATTAVVVQQQQQQQQQEQQQTPQVQVVVTAPQPVTPTEVKPIAVDGGAVAAASSAPVLMLQPVQPPPGILRARQLQMQKEQQLKQQRQQANKVPKKLRTINVENWGIFLLSRFQEYFQKKEHCDLTIRFPTRNAQLKTHSLVVHSCTDFFLERAKEGAIKNGVIDMEEEFTPEAVAPIIQFMYTGRLSLPHQTAYERLRDTAKRFNMSLLSKLIEDQLKEPAPSPKAKRGRKPKKEDPITQMKKIQRIEKKFSQDVSLG